jgi:hypothetical protein
MAVCGSSMFGKGSQYIKVGNGEFIAIEGSVTADRLGVSELRMPYKQLLKARIILKPGQTNYLLNHLGLGDNATFLTIKATYNSQALELDNYITYSYYNYPVQNFNFAQLLVLTGNSTNRVPQLYLSNPNTKYTVILDAMIGVIDDNYSFFNDDINQMGTSFTGLEYTDIKTFVIGESIVVYDKGVPARALIYFGLPYINSIALNGTFLIIDDESFGTVFLNFLTEYDAVQAHSLLNYVLEHPNINIDNIIPENDDVSPVIYFNSRAGATGSYILYNDGITIGSTFSTPYHTGTGATGSGFTFSTSISLSTYGTSSIIQKDKLKDLLIDYVDDDRDGIIELMDSNLVISGTAGEVNSIGLVGTYSLKFNFTDLAHNNLNNVIVNLDIII